VSRADRLAVAFLGLHPERRRRLVHEWGGHDGLLRAVRRGRLDGRERVPPNEDLGDVVTAAGCRVVMRGDDDYPQLLEWTENPPDVLFVRGEIPSSPAIAVVGTRRCTTYGRRLARSFARAIAVAGWVVVSGLARGIDGEAHRAMLDAPGLGIGVLGCGIDVVYPREHRDLYEQLASSGALVTEYPPGTAPNGWRFPPRNRIISGLAKAVVVVEAAVTGGALVTAARAAEQGRTVFAVPGDVDRAASEGCNLLIRDGAVPVLGPGDLIEALSLIVGPPLRTDVPDLPVAGMDIDVFGESLGISGPELLRTIARLEVAGLARIEGGRVYPG
jgi:DNA processing protein